MLYNVLGLAGYLIVNRLTALSFVHYPKENKIFEMNDLLPKIFKISKKIS